MWRSSLRLTARSFRHYRHFKMRRNQWEAGEMFEFKPNVARNLAFATGSSCLFFTGGAIYMYENGSFDEKSENDSTQPKAQPRKMAVSRGPWSQLWNSLSPHHKQFTVIFGINTVIFTMWKFPRSYTFMTEYFTRSPIHSRAIPKLLSVFSHKSLTCLALNMFTLYAFIGPATAIIGDEQFLVMYLTAGAVSSVAAHFVKCARKIPAISMGAGGAVLSVVTLVSLAAPEGQLHFYILPSIFPPFICSISHTLQAFVLVDVIGFAMKCRFFDHTARLAGVLFSIVYFKLGYKFHQWYTDLVVDFWHALRGRGEDP